MKSAQRENDELKGELEEIAFREATRLSLRILNYCSHREIDFIILSRVVCFNF